MSKVVSIRENGVEKQFTTDRIKTLLQDGTYAYWIPEDELDLVDKYITQNGDYSPTDDGHDGYRTVTVNVEGGGGGGGGGNQVHEGTTFPANSLGSNGDVYLLRAEGRTVETPDDILEAGYEYVYAIGTHEAGPYIDTGMKPYIAYESDGRLDIRYIITAEPTAGQAIFGVYGSGTGNWARTTSNGVKLIIGTSEIVIDATPGSRYTIIERMWGDHDVWITKDGHAYTNSDSIDYSPTWSENSIYLFAANGYSQRAANVAIMEFIIDYTAPNGNSYHRTLTPARRLSDGALGMLAGTSMFFENAGTGEFYEYGGADGEIIAVYHKESGVWVEILAGGSSLPDAGGHYFGTVSSGSGDSGDSGDTGDTENPIDAPVGTQTSETTSESDSSSTSDDAQESILDGSGTDSDDTSASETGSNTSGEEEYGESIIDDGI